MGIDIEINGGISLFLNGGEDILEVVICDLNVWIRNHKDDFYGWIITYSPYNDQIDITFENPKRGPLIDYVTGLSKFLKYAAQFELYAQGLLKYTEAWGDYAMGSIYVSSEKEVSIIRGMTNHGDCVDETIEWKNV